jgi:hypothetical protein
MCGVELKIPLNMGWGRAPHEGVPKIGARPQPMLSSVVDMKVQQGICCWLGSGHFSEGHTPLAQKAKSPQQRAF